DPEKAHQVERFLDDAGRAAALPAPRPAAVHAGADVAAAHPLAALQRPRLLGIFVTLFADLDAIGHLEAALLHLLLHQRGMLEPGSQRQFDAQGHLSGAGARSSRARTKAPLPRS